MIRSAGMMLLRQAGLSSALLINLAGQLDSAFYLCLPVDILRVLLHRIAGNMKRFPNSCIIHTLIKQDCHLSFPLRQPPDRSHVLQRIFFGFSLKKCPGKVRPE